MKVLVTGGAGYIGSTICSALIESGHIPVIMDSLVTGKKEFTKDRLFYEGDISDFELLKQIVKENKDIKYVIHCAALVVVNDSMKDPYAYYNENVSKSIKLYKYLERLGIKNIIFSSSASIYDDVQGFMVTEKSALNPRSPYAKTKYMMEMVLKDFCYAYGMKGLALRYFNPIGADPKFRSGSHIEFPTHVLGCLLSTALGQNKNFNITGINWPTRDGTGIRDYIHVWDLARAHVLAIEKFDSIFESGNNSSEKSYEAINLGTGKGVTVRELVNAFERVWGEKLNVLETDPRPGDIPGAYTNSSYALEKLDWTAEKPIEDGISDALKWEKIKSEINYSKK